MGRIVAFDFGTRRIGIAVSDPMGIVVRGHSTLSRTSLDEDLTHLATLLEEEEAHLWVMGLPLNADGSAGEMVTLAEEFACALKERCGIPFAWADESYSSLEADEILREKYRDPRRRRAERDMVAAQIILRHYLEFGPRRREE